MKSRDSHNLEWYLQEIKEIELLTVQEERKLAEKLSETRYQLVLATYKAAPARFMDSLEESSAKLRTEKDMRQRIAALKKKVDSQSKGSRAETVYRFLKN